MQKQPISPGKSNAPGSATGTTRGQTHGRAPKAWIDALKTDLPNATQIELRWRRGATDYEVIDMAGAVLILPELIEDFPKDDKERKKKAKDKTWTGLHADAVASDMWDLAKRWTGVHGPVCDFQLSIYRYTTKTGELTLTRDPIAKRCNLSGEKSSAIDDTGDRTTQSLVTIIQTQNSHIQAQNVSMLGYIKCCRDVLEGGAAIVRGAYEVANEGVKMQASVSEVAATIKREEREDIMNMESRKMSHEEIKRAIDMFGPEVAAFFRAKAEGRETPRDVRHASYLLWGTMADGDPLAGIDDDNEADDIRSAWSGCMTAADESAAVARCIAVAPLLKKHADTIKANANPYQLSLLGFIRSRLDQAAA